MVALNVSERKPEMRYRYITGYLENIREILNLRKLQINKEYSSSPFIGHYHAYFVNCDTSMIGEDQIEGN